VPNQRRVPDDNEPRLTPTPHFCGDKFTPMKADTGAAKLIIVKASGNTWFVLNCLLYIIVWFY